MNPELNRSPEKPLPLRAPVLLKATEESFRLLVESVKDYGIFMLSPEGIILSWNAGAARIKGFTAQEVIGKHFGIFYTQEARDKKHPQFELETAVREGKYEEEGWRVRKDGTQFWANVVITHLVSPEGKTVGFGKVTRDLTERKRAEDALRDSEEQARLVYETVKDYAILTLSPGGHVQIWNEGARRIKGYEASEIVGRHFSAFYPEEDNLVEKWRYELREATITGRFEDEGWRVRKDGTKFWANVVITALFDKKRALRGFSKVTRDMTERKRAEDRLKMANESLERRVQQRTDDLSKANIALRTEIEQRSRTENELLEAVRSRDEFLSIASHELRTPVTPLKLQLQGLLSHLRKGTLPALAPERLEKMAGTLDRSLHRLTKLIDSLLDVARINAGKIELHPERIDIAEAVQETVSRFQREAEVSGSTLTLEIANVGEAELDRVRLEQVLANLITNAIKFGAGKPIKVLVSRDQQWLRMAVVDLGIGIGPKDKERIFHRFEQVTQQSPNGGLGLGLYITKQIVEAQGGRISVESQLNVGTTFLVELPLPAEIGLA